MIGIGYESKVLSVLFCCNLNWFTSTEQYNLCKIVTGGNIEISCSLHLGVVPSGIIVLHVHHSSIYPYAAGG